MSLRFKSECFDVQIASNAIEALNLFSNGYRPNIILLDILMPGILGSALSRILYGTQELKNVPIIVMSAAPESSCKGKFKAAKYFIKPFDTAELIKEIKQIIL